MSRVSAVFFHIFYLHFEIFEIISKFFSYIHPLKDSSYHTYYQTSMSLSKPSPHYLILFLQMEISTHTHISTFVKPYLSVCLSCYLLECLYVSLHFCLCVCLALSLSFFFLSSLFHPILSNLSPSLPVWLPLVLPLMYFSFFPRLSLSFFFSPSLYLSLSGMSTHYISLNVCVSNLFLPS